MPLPPPPVARQRVHVRHIEIEGFLREDGLCELDASLTDVKDRDYPLASGLRPAGEPIHLLRIRLTIDTDYNIVEAFDQPWKTNEGGVGMYWGMFDASRHAKFSWTGLVHDPDHWKVGGLSVLLGLLLSLPILARNGATFGEALTLAVAANTVGAWFATVFAFWQTHYFVLGAAFARLLRAAGFLAAFFGGASAVSPAASAAARSSRRLTTFRAIVSKSERGEWTKHGCYAVDILTDQRRPD